MDLFEASIGGIANALDFGTRAGLKTLAGWLGWPVAFADSVELASALRFFYFDTIKIFTLLVLIIFIVSFIRGFFPPERTRRVLGQGKARGFLGSLLAALFGIVTPFCSCSAVPLFIGFVEAGIPLGVTFSFLVSSPMVNEVALVMLWGLFGWKIALLYIGAGVSVAVVSGIVIGRFKMEKYVEVFARTGGAALDEPKLLLRERAADAARGVAEILGKIWVYVLIGIGIGAVMHGWAPTGLLARYAGPGNPVAVPIAVLIGVPLYSNAAGTLPIVKELVRMGMQTGTALAFMMAVTALSLPEMILLRKVLKPRLLAVFIGILSVSIIAVGYLFNAILG
jgi:uncharacterized protein